jgi:leucyl/phenylalanyl-tRNA--protein transferase
MIWPRRTARDDITPDVLLKAYACGIFPMAESADDPTLHWIEPRLRGILPLDAFHVPRSLAKRLRSRQFQVSVDRDFDAVIAACASPAPGRENTWINHRIRRLYGELFDLGHCHTVEIYHEGTLVGGLYGLAIGGAFFGESMFHSMRDASKVALAHLVARLRFGGFVLLDTQFITNHLRQFGAAEVPRAVYSRMLEQAIERSVAPDTWTAPIDISDWLDGVRQGEPNVKVRASERE